jgi:hypothetical protein
LNEKMVNVTDPSWHCPPYTGDPFFFPGGKLGRPDEPGDDEL